MFQSKDAAQLRHVDHADSMNAEKLIQSLRRRFGEVAGAVAEFEFFFAQIGVGDLDGDPAIGAVAALVGR